MTTYSLRITTVLASISLIASTLVTGPAAYAAIGLDGAGTGSFACTSGTVEVTTYVVTGNTSCEGTVNVPSSITKIGDNAFKNNVLITDVFFNSDSSLTEVGISSFEGAAGLASFDFPFGVTAIGANSFLNATTLNAFTFLGAPPTAIGPDAFKTGFGGEVSAYVPPAPNGFGETGTWQGLTVQVSEGSRCSDGGYFLTGGNAIFQQVRCAGTAVIPSGITTINNNVFANDTDLLAVEFPKTLQVIGTGAFVDASSLSLVTFPPDSVLNIIGGRAFESTNITDISLPDGVSSIEARAFSNTKISWMTIPASVTYIGIEAFSNSTALTTIDFDPESVYASVTTDAFKNIPNLARLDLPTSVTSIEANAFQGSNSLVNLPIPPSVLTIHRNSFDLMEGLQRLAFLGNAPRYFDEPQSDALVTSRSVVAFVTSSATGFGDGLPVEDSLWKGLTVKPIDILPCSDSGYAAIKDNELFGNYYCTGHVTIPKTVISISSLAFSHAYNLSNIFFDPESSLTEIGAQAFSNAVSLESISIPATVTSVGQLAFEDNLSLTSISVEPGNPNYSSNDGTLFNKNQSQIIAYPLGNTRESYTIPSSVTSISPRAFRNARELAKLTIPEGVSAIDAEAFKYSGILDFTFEGNAPSLINVSSFAGVPSGAIANIRYNATGFGTDLTWFGLLVVRAAAPRSGGSYSDSELETGITRLSRDQVVKRVLSNGRPILRGTAAGRVIFDSGSTKLDALDLEILERAIAEYAGKEGTLVLVGFTKFKGQSTANARRIALERAKTVAETLDKLNASFKVGYFGFGIRNKRAPNSLDNRVQLRWLPAETSLRVGMA